MSWDDKKVRYSDREKKFSLSELKNEGNSPILELTWKWCTKNEGRTISERVNFGAGNAARAMKIGYKVHFFALHFVQRRCFEYIHYIVSIVPAKCEKSLKLNYSLGLARSIIKLISRPEIEPNDRLILNGNGYGMVIILHINFALHIYA